MLHLPKSQKWEQFSPSSLFSTIKCGSMDFLCQQPFQFLLALLVPASVSRAFSGHRLADSLRGWQSPWCCQLHERQRLEQNALSWSRQSASRDVQRQHPSGSLSPHQPQKTDHQRPEMETWPGRWLNILIVITEAPAAGYSPECRFQTFVLRFFTSRPEWMLPHFQGPGSWEDRARYFFQRFRVGGVKSQSHVSHFPSFQLIYRNCSLANKLGKNRNWWMVSVLFSESHRPGSFGKSKGRSMLVTSGETDIRLGTSRSRKIFWPLIDISWLSIWPKTDKTKKL